MIEAANENPRYRPSTMTRDEFLDTFGGVYEHSPWIAEAAYSDGLTRDQDSVAGLHGVLRAAVDGADRDRQLVAFGFPYILAVRGRTRQEILDNFRNRVNNDPEGEFREALKQVHRIALLRIEALFQES